MVHPFLGVPCCLALTLAPALPARAQDPGAYPSRLATMETILERFYRGESLSAGQKRLNAQVDAYNALAQQRNAKVDAARTQTDRDHAPLRTLADLLEAQDKNLGPAPAPSDRAAVRAYNQRVDARNETVRQYNLQAAAARQGAAAGDAELQRLDAGIDQARVRLDAERQALKARRDAFEAFRANDRDVAFFTALNRLLADLRAACRNRPTPALLTDLAKVRGYRRELARWASARQAGQDNGLVLVEAMVGDEPCSFIVDTGAQLVCLPEELIDALGEGGKLGEESALTLAGGQKLRGRAIRFDRISVAGGAAAQVDGVAVPASEVGIDGLLGQSFLKHFAYTIDPGQPGKLVLVRRD